MTTPFKLRVDWVCHTAYGDPVQVELHRMDQPWTVLHEAGNVADAVKYAIRWLDNRGFDWWCDFILHTSERHKYLTFHPRLKEPT